jgi:L-threonine kinase
MLNHNFKNICASIPCTCGELFQGALEGEQCLVSCPIDIFSKAHLTGIEPDSIRSYGKKVERALDRISERTCQRIGMEINNPLPVGRGYGTSTADIGAALFAANLAFNLDMNASEISQIAVQIEPTDSTLFSGLTLFAHRTGNFNLFLGTAPNAKLVILDPGGMIDTEDFNAQDWRDPLTRMVQEQKNAFLLLQQGVAAGDLLAIAEASTLSAKYHQAILFNPLIEIVLPLVKQVRAVGICRAHSGTIIGLIFAPDTDLEDAVKYLRRKIPMEIQIRSTALIGGGPILGVDPGNESN